MTMKTQWPNLWDAAKAALKGNFTEFNLTSRTRKTSDKKPNLTPKATRERRTNKTQS